MGDREGICRKYSAKNKKIDKNKNKEKKDNNIKDKNENNKKEEKAPNVSQCMNFIYDDFLF